jgi:hypothetical protein
MFEAKLRCSRGPLEKCNEAQRDYDEIIDE